MVLTSVDRLASVRRLLGQLEAQRPRNVLRAVVAQRDSQDRRLEYGGSAIACMTVRPLYGWDSLANGLLMRRVVSGDT